MQVWTCVEACWIINVGMLSMGEHMCEWESLQKPINTQEDHIHTLAPLVKHIPWIKGEEVFCNQWGQMGWQNDQTWVN